jgi:hypothetical protein
MHDRRRLAILASLLGFVAVVAIVVVATTGDSDDADEVAVDPTEAGEEVAEPTDADEAITVTEIALPDGVTVPTRGGVSAGFTEDDERIYLNVTIDGVEGRHLATFERDGSDFQCLTCDDLASPELDLRHPVMASDGKRFAVRSGSGVQSQSILECEPSILQCDRAALVPVTLPEGGSLALRNARLMIAPGGEQALFTNIRADGILLPSIGELVREDDRYVVTDARALAGFRPTFTGPSDDLELAEGNWGEAKGFSDGGASVLYYSTFDSLNFDTVELDLLSGSLTRLTSHPEYDEDLEVTEDGEWIAQASYRNAERMRAFSLVPRPAIVDAGLRSPVALLRNQGGRRSFDLFVFPIDAAGDEIEVARQVTDAGTGDDPDLNSRGQSRWSHDGTALVFAEEDADALGTARLMLAEFPDREPVEPIPPVPTPVPEWAPLLDEVPSPTEQVTGVLRGRDSGQANVELDLALAPGASVVDIRVTYEAYSDDGCSFIDGTETATVDGFDFTWTADLEVTGCHEGSLVADVSGRVLDPATTAEGSVVTTYDGERVEGLPDPPYGEG